MAKSPTKRKVTKNRIQEIVEAAEAASIYVGLWTKKETDKISRSELVITPSKSGYHVGKYSVRNINQVWQVFDEWGSLVNPFSSKKSAVYWCVLAHTDRIKQSQTLMYQDVRLSKYTQDHANYQYRKARATIRKDYFTVDVCNARMAKNESLLEDARNDLEKTLNSAKYLKGIWEKSL